MSEETKELKTEFGASHLEQKVDMIGRAFERLLDVLLVSVGQLDFRLRGQIEEIKAILKVPPQA